MIVFTAGNIERLHSAIGYHTPKEAEKAFHENMSIHDKSCGMMVWACHFI